MNKLQGPLSYISVALAISITCLALAVAGNVPYHFGLLLLPEQIMLVILGFALAQGFLQRSHASWKLPIDTGLAAICFATFMWAAWRYPEISSNFFKFENEISAIGLIVIPMLLEVLRRKTGWSLVFVVLAFILYALLADKVPGTLQGRAVPFVELLGYLTIDSTAMLGTPLTIVVNIVVVYILFGGFLLATGGSEWFTDLSSALVGGTVGGSAKISIVSSALFGSISGSAVANVASTGVITIPLMKRGGFSPRMAASFEAVASTGGQMMPPVMGAAAFLMAEFLEVPYTTVVVAAIVPSFLFFWAVLIQADLEARKSGIPPIPADMIPRMADVLREGWYFPLPFVLLIGSLFWLNRSPAEAAIWATILVTILNVIFGYKGKRISLGAIWKALRSTGAASVEILIIGAVAGLVIGVLQATGLGFGLTFLMVSIGQSSLLLLLILTAFICIILGMGMPTTGIYLLVATLAAPPLIELGVTPIAAHFFIFYFGMLSMISPPVAVAAFAAASISGANAMQTALTSVRIGWTAFIIPFVFVYSPSLLLQGTPAENTMSFVFATLGVFLISVGIIGRIWTPLSTFQRLVIVLIGLLTLFPTDFLPFGTYLQMTGLAVVALLIWSIWRAKQPVLKSAP
ncbi:MAG: TRAP transporter fused permease subunit [Rhizobiales bacterium]|nr:TRAP transporter fused permease subunit [Hyphomicrobiales bacterium]